MKLRWNSRLASHLAVVVIVITLLLLGWRMSPNVAWFPDLETEPLFEPDELPSLRDVIDQPEEESRVKPVPAAPQEEKPDVPSEPVQAAEAEALQPEVTPTPPQPQLRDLEAERLYESWSRARQLLRQRDLAGAEQAYLELTNRWPKHPDLVGELGNVYVLLGEKNSARTAFRRAQKLLEPMGPSLQLEAVTRWLERHR
ncbi:MAG: hypothetical protein OXG03_03100 [Gammaproteobacteria bacterium]|nr:hypothetical protein [Gammaproteobacteria bacterium]